MTEKAADAVRDALANPAAGDVLVFLPGMGEIRRVMGDVSAAADRADAVVLPMHSSLTPEEQDRALRPDPDGRRKIILSTNIAETSLTIEGVRTVIDTGTARVLKHDPTRGLERLELQRISKASADQRAGRAGRLGPGTCLRLWTAEDHRLRPAAEEPEVRRADLAATVLTLHEWGYADSAAFDWYQPPAPEMLAGAERLLGMLGALRDGKITPVGREMLHFPLHPRLSRMLVAALEWGYAAEGAALAAVLSAVGDRDIFLDSRNPRSSASSAGPSDILLRLDALREAEAARFSPDLTYRGIDPNAAREASRLSRELSRGDPRGIPEDVALKLVFLAYPDRLTRRREARGEKGVMVGGRGVNLEPASVVRNYDAEFYVSLDPYETMRDGRLEARVRIASAVREEWVAELFPGDVRRERAVEFDEARQAVVGVARTVFHDLALREDRNAPVDPDLAGAALAKELAKRAGEVFAADESATAWLSRVRWLTRRMPELGLPTFTAEELAECLAPACRGKRSLAEVAGRSLLPALQDRLDYKQSRALDEHAPEALRVPTGNRIRLRYPEDPERPPVLAVRLQELFGLAETPRIAAGRSGVVLELLGPNYRPVQVTEDLRSFWNGVYQQVRKDLRARYPKHSWPEDPWTAPPVSKGRPTK
jgi:ATP-dependent helicase HrpB